MIVRLSILTSLFALFAIGFASLVENDARQGSTMVGSIGCFDQGAVCARPAVN